MRPSAHITKIHVLKSSPKILESKYRGAGECRFLGLECPLLRASPPALSSDTAGVMDGPLN